MARINIEDEFFDDATAVAVKMGDADKAMGQALRLIRWAQLQIKAGKPTTREEFNRRGFSEMLAPEFVTLDGDTVKVRGANAHFGWLEKKRAAGAKGGRSKTEAKTKHLKQNRSKSKVTEASFSISSSFSSSSSGSSGVTESPADAVVPADLALNADIWKAYSEAYEVRYQTKPVRNAKVNGQIAQLAKRLGQEAPAVARFYVTLAKSYYVAKVHDFGLCLGDAEALRTQWATGRTVTQADARQADNAQTLANQMKKYGTGT